MTKILSLRYFFAVILLLFKIYAAKAQSIRYLGIENGLSNNAVTAIYKDPYGYMWFGTYDGLNRFDGQKFNIFRNSWGDKGSLGNNHITAIAGNSDEILVGTQKGLYGYEYLTSKFTILSYQRSGSSQIRPVDFNISALTNNGKGVTYIAGENAGLLTFTSKSKYCKQIAGPSGKDKDYSVEALALDNLGHLFVMLRNSGLYRLNSTSNTLELVTNKLNSATCLLFDNNNYRLLVGTENGIYSYNLKNGLVEPFEYSKVHLISNNITDLKFDESQNLWICTNGGGIDIVSLKRGEIRHLTPGKEQGTLKSGAISAVYIDDESRKWIATLRGGLNVIDVVQGGFKRYSHDPFNTNSVVNNFILSFCEDEKKNIWIGTDGGGLSYWNRSNNTYQHYVHNANPNSLKSNFVVSILKDHENKIWVATFSGGIDAFDAKSNNFKHYTIFNPLLKSEERNFWKLYEDSNHNLWAGATRGGALYFYDRKMDRFVVYDQKLTNIHVIFEDAAKRLWVGDYSYLVNIDPVTHRSKRYYIGYALRSICQNDKNSLWIGTEGGGLLNFDLRTSKYKRYTQNNGMAGNSVLNALVANNGDVWCSTYNGLSRFETRKGHFTNFNVADGLQSNQFNYNAGLKLSSGEMLFGGISGFNLFDPDSIRLMAKQPKLRLNEIRVNNVAIEGTSKLTDGKPIVQLQSMTVPYNDATIAIEYTALAYSLQDKINYAYYLEGWDHGWNMVGKLQTAYYTRLNEGKYKLFIKATDTQGNWSDNTLSVMITVLPPWYRSWWAYLIYISVVSSLVYSFWLYRIRQQKLKYEVQIANLNIEREKELNEKKLAFFTNISHELRTPLTLIINPIKDILTRNKGEDEELNVVYRNARRLLGLVDHLLLFRKTESENTNILVSRLNFTTTCNDVFMCFTHQAKIKHLNYSLDNVAENIELYADREKIEIALFNLISNAIKFTPDGGTIAVTIKDYENHVVFEIADNGVGINEEVGDKLFEKFFRVKDKVNAKSGFGIGLYLVKNFITSHGGTIAYSANVMGGTTFVMNLPKGYKHFSPEQITESSDLITHVEELIDHDNKEVVQEEDNANLELLISDRQSILVIDDNDQIRNYVKRLLAPDFRVMEADNGATGLEMAKKYLPDLILSDIVMEELNGIELCTVLKNDNTTNHIPIILLTGNATPELMLKSINEGAADFISKPFEKDVLLAKIKSVLRSRKELQNYFYKEITLKNSTRNVSEEHKDFLYNCISIIEAHLTDTQFDVDMLAKMMKISYPTLFKRIKATTGKSVNNFIRFVRLRKAAELLIRTNCNIAEAAFKVGINDMKYFREQFNKQFNQNPSDFVKKHRSNFQTTYRVQEGRF